MFNSIPENALSEFFAEADEITERVNTQLARVENEGISSETIDSVYRDIHTLKGSAQLFGFKNIGMVAHALEACLEPVRKKKTELTPELLDQAFKSLDLIDRILKDPDKDLDDDPVIRMEVQTLIPQLISIATSLFGGNHKVINEGVRIAEHNEELRDKLIDYKEISPEANSEVSADDPFEDKKPPPSEIKSAVKPEPKLEVKAEIKKEVKSEAVREVKEVSQDEEKQVRPANLNIVTENTMTAANKQAAAETQKAPDEVKRGKPEGEGQEAAGGESSTIRVQVGLLDRLMNLVGEMVLVRNQVLQYSLRSDDYEFLNLSQRLDLVTSELQEDVMRTRMQPIGSILTKFQRVVRDLARDLGKHIDLTIKGAETELDKSLLEAIKDPLTHIIRNSCDHGLETIEERKKVGKSETGHILIRSFHEGGQVVIEITDDGRGLHYQRILAKAVEKKIVAPEKAQYLSEREIGLLIFAAGFSTADQVSAISGRGVGMDVVRTNIEKVGGIVDLSSVQGKGTTLRLRIPLTLAIVPAMIVKSSTELFAIPQVKLQELVRVDMDDDGPKVELLQGFPVYRLRGQLLPLIFMDEVFGLTEVNGDVNKKRIYNIVVLTGEGDPFGLVVDEIRDTADIVVKPLSQFLKKLSVYSGATIMGDGSVSLIVDVMGLGERARVINTGVKKQELDALGASTVKVFGNETQELLFFELNTPGRYCLPLALVQRLEEFSVKQIEISGKERIVKYRDSILPLINLNDYLKFKPTTDNKVEKISVVVVAKRRRIFGIEVNQILDVIDVNSEIEAPLKETAGILGSIIVGDQIATVVDVLAIIEDILNGDEAIPITSKRPKKDLGAGKVIRPSKILFAEDTLFFVRQVTKILETAGYEVFHVADGEQAYKQLRNSPIGTYDVILSDIEMPNMNGFELARTVRKDPNFASIPMIALTTRFKETDVAFGRECGFSRYLEKIKTDQLLEAIREEVGGKAS
jgi:two-component system chemotaxis sensor kinase CheA